MLTIGTAALPLADIGDHMDWDGGWGVVMMIAMLLFWGFVIVAAVWLLREVVSRRPRDGGDPLELLDRRLAEGTISPDDYANRKAILSGGEPPD